MSCAHPIMGNLPANERKMCTIFNLIETNYFVKTLKQKYFSYKGRNISRTNQIQTLASFEYPSLDSR